MRPSSVEFHLGHQGAADIPAARGAHVQDADYGVSLLPAYQEAYGLPGGVIDYTLTLANTGNVTDTIDLSLGAIPERWDAELSEASFTLAAGETAEFTLSVTIPADALEGEALQGFNAFRFDTPALEMVEIEPSGSDVPPEDCRDISVTFSYPVEVKTVSRSLRVQAAGREFPFTAAYARPEEAQGEGLVDPAERRRLVLSLRRELPWNTDVEVRLLAGAGVHDDALADAILELSGGWAAAAVLLATHAPSPAAPARRRIAACGETSIGSKGKAQPDGKSAAIPPAAGHCGPRRRLSTGSYSSGAKRRPMPSSTARASSRVINRLCPERT